MPIPLPLLVRRVARPFVDKPLVNSLARTGGNKGVPQHVIAPEHLPLRVFHRPPEVIMGFVVGNGHGSGPLRLASHDGRLAEEI